MKLQLNDKVYDTLKWVALIGICHALWYACICVELALRRTNRIHDHSNRHFFRDDPWIIQYAVQGR